MILTKNKHRKRNQAESISLCVVPYFAHIDHSNYNGEKNQSDQSNQRIKLGGKILLFEYRINVQTIYNKNFTNPSIK